MMHRCSSSHVGPCTCGMFHGQGNSFSTMLFSVPNHRPFDESEIYGLSSSAAAVAAASSSSVDCTLSLGTPSTRLTENEKRVHHERRPSCVSNFCWDILQSKHNAASPLASHKGSRGNGGGATNSGGDPLLARRCANCDTTSTPLWRNGPRGPKSLCNACGIRFKKEERRATAAAATGGVTSAAAQGLLVEPQHMINSSWVHHSQTPHKIPCLSSAYAGNEFRFIDGDDHDSDAGVPFLSWRLSVTDRPGLVHDFTR